VIVEPIAGSTGVLIPPRGYLKRLREICDRHGILLIFDEVITGFGRTGSAFAAQEFGVTPDILTVAKGLTNGCVPMGAVLVKKSIYDAFMQGPEGSVELFHGYTYSAHPTACAAGLATLAIYNRDGLLTRVKSLARYWEDAAHSLRGLPHVIDVRNYGLMLGLELESIPGKVGARAFDTYAKCFERGLLVRQSGDILALSPPLTFLMAVAARQQKFRWWGLLGVAFGFAGMLVIAGPGSGAIPSADGLGWFALCLIAPALYAMANVATSIFRPPSGRQRQ